MVRGCLLMGAPTVLSGVVAWLVFPASPFLASIAGLATFVGVAWLVSREMPPYGGG